jgi:Fe/S biogenesis protein NfuA
MSTELLSQEELKTKVQELLDDMINPAVAGHGGVIRLVDVKDDWVYLFMGGGCQGCGMADATLKQGIETMLKEELPQVKGIIDQTNHAEGLNPYFQPTE